MKQYIKNKNWWVFGYSVFAGYMSVAQYAEYGLLGLFDSLLFFLVMFMFGWYAKEREIRIQETKDTDAP
jgi:hypothetical protein